VRLPALWLLLFSVFAASSCGGDEAQPLTLEQRVVAAEDAPGWKDDPVEQGQQTTDLGEFITALQELAIDADPETTTDTFREAGFQAAILDVRFLGETHSRDAPHVFSAAIQLESEDGAQSALDWLHEDALKPCPRTCAVRISEFDVEGISGARGVRRSQSAEDIEALGQPDDVPFESYTVLFSDGQFAYSVDVSGPPGSVSEQQAQEISTALHSRVEGAPPPSE
jgi:hypothetical protein